MSEKLLELAVQLTQTAMGPNTHWIGNEKEVAQFVEVIAHKLQELRAGRATA